MENRENFCVIMAGGVGRRLWPVSTVSTPKQFLDLLGSGRTLLQQTFDRFSEIFPPENIIVVTHNDYFDLVQEQLPQISPDNILKEPIRRDTSACIAYAVHKIHSRVGYANIVVTPSDHIIGMESKFIKEIDKAINFVNKKDVLVALGIKPLRPEVGYGYIQVADKGELKKEGYDNLHDNLYKAKTFTEKPDLDMAKLFIDTGEFFWNSGIFVWNTDSILKAFKSHLPEVSSLFTRAERQWDSADTELSTINKLYSEVQNISIDYGIMESAENVYLFTCDFTWTDMGSWSSLHDSSAPTPEGNSGVDENIHIYNSENNILRLPDNRKAIIHGLSNFIVTESDDILLICNRDDERKIKRFMEELRLNKE